MSITEALRGAKKLSQGRISYFYTCNCNITILTICILEACITRYHPFMVPLFPRTTSYSKPYAWLSTFGHILDRHGGTDLNGLRGCRLGRSRGR